MLAICSSFQGIFRHRAVIALVDQCAVSIASFGTGVLLSRAFVGSNRAQLGLYYLAVTIGILITESQNALVSTPHTVTAPKLEADALPRFSGSSLIHHGALSLLITMLLSFAALAAPGVGLKSHAPMLWATAITAGALGLRNFARFLNFALHRPHVACVADWIVTLLQMVGIGLLWRWEVLSAWSAVAVIGVASLAGGVVALLWSRRHLQPRFSAAWAGFRANWRLSRWVFASGIVWNLGTSIYPWFIDTLSGTLQAAAWGNCNTISSLGNPLLMGLQNWIAPGVAHAYADRDVAQFRHYVYRGAFLFVLLAPPMILVSAWVSQPLLHRVYRDTTPGTQALVVVLAAGSLIQSASFVISRGLFSLGRGDLDLLANIVPVVILLIVGFPAIHRYGAMGGACSLLTAQLLSTLVRTGMFAMVALAAAGAGRSIRDDSPMVLEQSIAEVA